MPSDLDERPTALYRLRDAVGHLLYVGITTNPAERFRKHESLSPWWPLVAAHTVDWQTNRPAAALAEATAIRDEAPLYNRAGSDAADALGRDFPIGNEVSTAELRARLADVVHTIAVEGGITFVTKNGRRIAALAPIAVGEAAEAELNRRPA
ncbi:GIY-YIG nuclease family protein [Streptomyces sp. NPDC057456]|uniref:GIY-YIG nuclease family protein n=1 Tax=Streptomyces sp. NPDC057456 TaxID=3346139 RepID=UPI0036B5421A